MSTFTDGICTLQVVTLNEAKALLKVDDDLIIAVYDYWLNKRLRLVCYYVVLLVSVSELTSGPISTWMGDLLAGKPS